MGSASGGGGGAAQAVSFEAALGVWPIEASGTPMLFVSVTDPLDPDNGVSGTVAEDSVWLRTDNYSFWVLTDGEWVEQDNAPPEPASPSYVGHGALEVVAGTSGTLTPDLPAGLEPGDLIVAHITTRGSAYDSTTGYPAGYTRVGQIAYNDSAAGLMATALAWKRAEADEDAPSWNVADVISGPDGGVAVTLHAVRHIVATGDPVDASAFNGHNSQAFGCPDLTTSVDSSYVLGFDQAYGGPQAVMWGTWD